ncbi:hypothetical protein SISNIDRAFT_444190 [Sistotremastrum niveocremeum HHB9708]|uniref:Uncharacterized protein n=2 Tax=Sistotremastraceae TaxID=3402574 RepID=A0A164R6E9_9AGAM|nr:hypothetical protein SISNIDRAFT_444190 [Sistotremastrum niveocremeum HHB9708]KZT42815.1 hypothetical protein SISSUDRAFT_1015371 [Sistotremastrum suecicum HHB10207 ss-3]
MTDDKRAPTDSEARHDTVPPPSVPSTSEARPQTGASASRPSGLLDRAFSKDNRQTARRFFSAYAETWIGLSPLWLMGEALTPGKKVGSKFNKGKSKLISSAEEIKALVSTSSHDIVVILDEKLKVGQQDRIRAAEVIKAAGENAILVVTSSLEKFQTQIKSNSAVGPQLKKSVAANGRDVVVVMDKALRHPIVITGVTKFARSKGIPHADALLRLASLGLSKILTALPDEELPGTEAAIQEVDAAELERTSSIEATEEAAQIGKSGEGSAPKVEDGDPYEKMRKENTCVLM